MKKLFLLICLFVFAGASLLAQNKVITGAVTSAVAGEGSLPGVTVLVKGTTIGAITDLNGNYSVSAPTTATTLVFSYVGMKTQEVEIAGRSVVNCVMESESVGLNEVVVTAFGIKRQARELGVATAQVSSQQLTQAGASNVINSMAAKVSGLQINTVNNGVTADTRITLRGNRHFLASNQALVVLDGVPVSADYLSQINPNDIENVNVLKGASAAALYGNDASNGVLVITTKRGGGNIPVIKISNVTTFESISYLPKLQARFGSGSGEDTINFLPEYTFWIGNNRNTDPYTSYENQSYGPEFNGQDVILGGKLIDGTFQTVKYSPVKNNIKKFFDTGISLQNDISYSVGDNKNNFYLSLQDVKTTGTTPGDKYRRTGIRVSGARTTGIFHADYTVGFNQNNINTSGGDFNQQRGVYWNVLNTPAQVDLTLYKDINNNKFADLDGYFNAYYPNPYWQLAHSRNITRSENLLGSFVLSLTPAKWVTLSYRTGLTYSVNNYNYFRDGAVYSSYMVADPWEAGHNSASSPFPGVSGDQLSNSFVLTGDFLAQFDHKIGDFSGKLILGNSIYTNKYRYVGVANNTIVIPELYNIGYRLGEPGAGESIQQRNSIGLFADLTLGYKDFAFLHASVRNDWDSRLTAANRSFLYPGVDASIILTDAIPALKNNSVLSFAKIRGGWSQTGQVSIGWYATVPSFVPGSGFPFNTSGYLLSTSLSNPKLKPEITDEIEIGTELSFIKNRIHLELNVYQSKTKDQTIPASISDATGYNQAYINAGELMTKGIETDLKLTPLLSFGDFDWNLSVNYTYQINKVMSIFPGLNELPIQDNSYAIVGQQFPILKVTDVVRDPQGHIVVDPTTGYPIKDPALHNVGHGNPNHILGIVNSFTFKGLTLNAIVEYRSGNMIYNAVGRSLDFTGVSWHSAQNGRENFIFPNSVINTGTTANPVYVENTNVLTRNASRTLWNSTEYYRCGRTYVTSAAFWKLREVSLNYDIPIKNILGGAIKDAQIGIVGRNLIMLRPVTNMWTDPEFNLRGGTSNAVGTTNENQTPPTRIMGFSVKLTF